MRKFTLIFIVFAAYILWTYAVMPDVQTSIVAIQTGSNKDLIIKLWVIALTGVLVFFGIFYLIGKLPGS